MLERLEGIRVVSTDRAVQAMLEDENWPRRQVTLRFAFDELLTLGALEQALVLRHDPHAITIEDRSFFGMWVTPESGAELMSRHCEWASPNTEHFPTQAQGAFAGLPVKIWFTHEKWLFVVQAPYIQDFRERIR